MSSARINLCWLILFAVTLPLGVVISTHLARRSFEKVKMRGQTITVKGYAEQPITADRGAWSASVVIRDADRTAAYVQLEKDRAKLLDMLREYKFDADMVRWQPVEIDTLYARDVKGNRTNQIELYVISQQFSIEASDVHLISQVARKAGTLIGDGVELQADDPQYLYTKMDQKKLHMIAEATTNARTRAEQLVKHSNSQLGPLRSASQGVFQITPAYSTKVSGSGYNDTSSIAKAIKAVVTVEYAIQ